MTAVNVTLIGLLGAAIGSFLNVVIHRVPRGESVVHPRSRCPSCGTEISPLDNVPVLSWLWLRGACRHCGARISPRYPAVELLTALCFAGVALTRGVDDDLVTQLALVTVLIAAAGIDLEHQTIPNVLLLPAAVWGVVAGAVVMTSELPELLIAGAGAFLAMLVIALIQPKGMGMGDVKLAGVLGLYLGQSVLPALLVGFLTGSLVGLGIMAREGAGARKRKVPFGPFLAVGGLVALFAGPELIDLYRDSFL
jgi:leader peptidase (prepilin peptidase) / N-methyltransferase